MLTDILIKLIISILNQFTEKDLEELIAQYPKDMGAILGQLIQGNPQPLMDFLNKSRSETRKFLTKVLSIRNAKQKQDKALLINNYEEIIALVQESSEKIERPLLVKNFFGNKEWFSYWEVKYRSKEEIKADREKEKEKAKQAKKEAKAKAKTEETKEEGKESKEATKETSKKTYIEFSEDIQVWVFPSSEELELFDGLLENMKEREDGRLNEDELKYGRKLIKLMPHKAQLEPSSVFQRMIRRENLVIEDTVEELGEMMANINDSTAYLSPNKTLISSAFDYISSWIIRRT